MRFLNTITVPQVTALPASSTAGSLTFFGSTIYVWNGSAWNAMNNLTKADVGLGNVDNTSDANKPISTAAASALSGKAATGAIASSGLTMNATTIAGRTTTGSGAIQELTGTAVTSILDLFTSSTKGLAPSSGGGTANYLRADGTWASPPGTATAIADGDKGDITVSNSGATWTIDTNTISLTKLLDINSSTFIGRITASAGDPEVLTASQATSLLDVFSTGGKGLVPASGGMAGRYLRADATWATVIDGIADNGIALTKLASMNQYSFLGRGFGTGNVEVINGTTATANLDIFTTSFKGLTPSSPGGTATFLRADGTWAAPTSAGTSTVTPANRAWAPTDMSAAQVVGWWDANLTSSMTIISNAVQEWRSRVSGIAANNTYSPQYPTYSATALNSKPGLTFDGSMYLDISSVTPFPLGKQDGNIFIVARATTSTGGFIRNAFGYGGASAGTGRAVGTNTDDGFIYDVSSNNVTIAGTTAKWFGNTRIVNCANTGQGTGISYAVDGGTFSNTATATTNTDTYLSGRIGNWPVFGGGFVGIIQEIIVVSGTMTAAEIQQMDGYLAAKWGIQANLPSNHPYKSAAPTITPPTYTAVSQNSGSNPVELTAPVSRVTGNAVVTGNISAANLSGLNTGDQTIWLTGDVTGMGTDTFSTTLATVNSAPGTYGSSLVVPRITIDGKGRITTVTTQNVLGTEDALPLGATTLYPSSAPTAPTQGVKLFGMRRANRHFPGWISPTGRTERISGWLGSNTRYEIMANLSATTPTAVGCNFTAVGTISTVALSSSTFLTMQRRFSQSTATAGGLLEMYGPALCARRPATGGGGFHAAWRFGIAALPTDARLFCGLSANTGAMTAADPTGLASIVGLAKTTGNTTTLVMIANGGSGTAQSITLPNTGSMTNIAGTFWQVELFCKAQDTLIGYRVIRTSTAGVEATDEGTITGTAGNAGGIPADTTLFAPHIMMNAVSATTTTLQFSQFFMEID